MGIYDQLSEFQRHSGEDVSAEFRVPPQEADSFASRLKMALGRIGISTVRGRSDEDGNVRIGARLTGKAAERFLEGCPAKKRHR